MATLEQLMGVPWDAAAGQPTFLMRRCTELMSKDLDHFTVEDLRIMLGQQIGVPWLLPRVVQVLLDDPLASGDYYPGDLLAAVQRLPQECWDPFPAERAALAQRLQTPG